MQPITIAWYSATSPLKGTFLSVQNIQRSIVVQLVSALTQRNVLGVDALLWVQPLMASCWHCQVFFNHNHGGRRICFVTKSASYEHNFWGRRNSNETMPFCYFGNFQGVGINIAQHQSEVRYTLKMSLTTGSRPCMWCALFPYVIHCPKYQYLFESNETANILNFPAKHISTEDIFIHIFGCTVSRVYSLNEFVFKICMDYDDMAI